MAFDTNSFPSEPKWDKFKEKYTKNLNGNSGNYHSWYIVEDEGLFKDIWDLNEGKTDIKTTCNKYPNGLQFTIPAVNYHTGQILEISCKCNYGNPEIPIPGIDYLMPFVKLKGMDGFASMGANKLFPLRGTLTMLLLDNTHWPAMVRGSIILINRKYVENSKKGSE